MNGSVVGAASSYTYTPASGDSVRCVLTSNHTPCLVTPTVSSTTIRMMVYPVSTPSVTIAVSPNDTVCSGTPVTFTATASGGATSLTYQWIKNGSVVGAGTSYTYTPASGDSVRCVLSTTDPCATMSSVSSSTIHMTVIPTVVPTISISASPNDTICGDQVVTFTATASGGGSSPTYQWKVNGVNVGSGTTVYSYTPVNGDSVRCVFTSTAPCATPSTVSSNTINVAVVSVSHPAITLSGPAALPIGSPVTITAAVTGAGSSYSLRWMNWGTYFTTTTIPLVTYTKTLPTDSITAQVFSDDYCYDSTVSGVHVVMEEKVLVGNLQSEVGSLRVYPNPVGDVVHISGLRELASYRLMDIVGRVMIQGSLGKGDNEVNLVSASPGIYFLEITIQNERVVKRIIKD